MYIKEDRLTPSLASFTNGQKTKNTIFRHWGTQQNTWSTYDEEGFRTGDYSTEEQVFAPFQYYGNGAVRATNAHKRIYGLLGVTVESLEEESYEGIESCWFYLKNVVDTYEITRGNINGYVKMHSDIDTEYTTTLNYNPVSLDSTATKTNEQIITECLNGSAHVEYGTEGVDKLTSLVLLDSAGVLFERRLTVTLRKVSDKATVQQTYGSHYVNAPSKYVVSATVTMVFTRIKEPNDAACDAYMAEVQAKVTAIDDLSGVAPDVVKKRFGTTAQVEPTRFTPMNAGLLAMYNTMVNYTPTALNSGSGYILVEGARDLTGAEFTDMLGKALDTGFVKESASFLERLLSVLMIILTIVLIIVLTPAGATLLAFSTTASIVFMVSMAVQIGIAEAFRRDGNYAAANYIAGAVQFLGVVAQVVGFVGMAMSGIDAKAVIDKLTGGLTSITSSTSNMLQKGIQLASSSMQIYSDYIDPVPGEIDKLSKEIAAQKKELEDYSGGESINKVRRYTDSPHENPYDMNAQMANIPYLMTQGKIENSLTQYYN